MQQSQRNQQLSSGITNSLIQRSTVHLEKVINPNLVRHSLGEFRELLQDKERLNRFPYDERTRLGYTPPGIEGFQQSDALNTRRHAFDFHPRMSLNSPMLSAFFWAVRDIGLDVLSEVENIQRGITFTTSKRAHHILRAAEYFDDCSTPDDILFESHLDFGLLTVFVGTGVSGLQTLKDGVWEDEVLPVGDVLIGVGTSLSKLCPSLRPHRHRVVGGGGSRLSPFMFIEPHPQTLFPNGETYGEALTRILGDVRKS